MERPAMVATGVPHLDMILGGGIVAHSVVLLCGQPGTGKTVLAGQIMAAAVDRGEPVLFVTAFSEPQARLIAHLRSFQFFRPYAIGAAIKLLNLQLPLLTGLDSAADTLMREARAHGAKLVVLDALDGALLSSPDLLTTTTFLYNLSAKLSLLGISLIMTLAAVPSAALTRPDLAPVDTIIALSQEHASGTIRTLRVIKHRGVEPLPGYHRFVIGDEGVRCFARLETLPHPDEAEVDQQRAAFGIRALDVAMEGGPQHITSTMLHGPAGVVRPLGLRWLLHGLHGQQHGSLVSLREPATRLLRGGIGVEPLHQAIADGRLLLYSYHPADLVPDRLAHELLDGLHSAVRRRVLIDGVGVLAQRLAAEGRGLEFWAALLSGLRAGGATTLLLDDRRLEASAAAMTLPDRPRAMTLPDQPRELAALPGRPELDPLLDNTVQVHLREGSTYCRVLDMRYGRFDAQAVALDG